MNTKSAIWFGTVVGGFIGGYIPLIWGGSAFSFSGIFFNALGAIVGIYIAFKLTQE